MIIFNKQKDQKEFISKIVGLTPEEFIALAKVLEVKMSDVDAETGEYTLRDAEKVLEDCVNTFTKLPHRARKEILKVMTK